MARPSADRATYFASPAAFRRWLAKHHASASELLVGFHKVATGKPSLTWPESVDQALCFGWIDGIRRRVDEDRYTIRFTPRRAKSIWSTVNIARVAELSAQGLMTPAGVAAFARRTEENSRRYSYESIAEARFEAKQLRTFEANREAWRFFEALPPSYRHRVTYWIAIAKTDATKEKRLRTLIDACAARRRL